MPLWEKKRIVLADWRQLYKLLNNSDFIIEVVDARNPLGTRSRRLEDYVRVKGKPFILVLNKTDLVPKRIVDEWIDYFLRRGLKAIGVSATYRMGTLRLRKRIIEITRGIQGDKKVGLIAGVPKTGKSSIINVLKGKHSASTSPYPGKPGYTHHYSLYKIDKGLYIYDTPGVFPDAADPLEKSIRIYSPEKLDDPVKYAVGLMKKILKDNPGLLRDIYGIELAEDPYRTLELLAEKRGWLEKKTREPLIEEAARTVIRDYLSGKIRFYYNPPSMKKDY